MRPTSCSRLPRAKPTSTARTLINPRNVPVALWGMGVYGQDEWKATKNLKLTLALRVERNSNPVCQTNCFANLTGPFADTVAAQAGYTGSERCSIQHRH